MIINEYFCYNRQLLSVFLFCDKKKLRKFVCFLDSNWDRRQSWSQIHSLARFHRYLLSWWNNIVMWRQKIWIVNTTCSSKLNIYITFSFTYKQNTIAIHEKNKKNKFTLVMRFNKYMRLRHVYRVCVITYGMVLLMQYIYRTLNSFRCQNLFIFRIF